MHSVPGPFITGELVNTGRQCKFFLHTVAESPCHVTGISRSGATFSSVPQPIQGCFEENAGTGHVV